MAGHGDDLTDTGEELDYEGETEDYPPGEEDEGEDNGDANDQEVRFSFFV